MSNGEKKETMTMMEKHDLVWSNMSLSYECISFGKGLYQVRGLQTYTVRLISRGDIHI